MVFVFVFGIEAVIKITGLGPRFYFSDKQNQFDFFLVVISLTGFLQAFIPINITVLRVMRGTRILRIFKSMTELSELLGALYLSIKSFSYTMLLSLLLLFVFALMGIRLFS
jgi:hypothetical protein